mgnify:CR=1 FL=1
MEVLRTGRVWNGRRRHDRLRILQEVERRLAVDLYAHFHGVLGIIAAHAKDSLHR